MRVFTESITNWVHHLSIHSVIMMMFMLVPLTKSEETGMAMGILFKGDRPYLGAGILDGMITIPLGSIAGGLSMNAMTDYTISFIDILVNLVLVMIIAALIISGLWIAPAKMIFGFNTFGTGPVQPQV